jgi:prepilin-type N-terminal cleavage/methylation domain-containing protein
VTLRDSRAGLSLIELMVAIVILAVGVLALAAGSGAVTRTLYGARQATIATQLATLQLDQLRAEAGTTSPRCAAVSLSSGGPVIRQNVTMIWTVTGTARREARVVFTYPTGRGASRTDTLATIIPCPP